MILKIRNLSNWLKDKSLRKISFSDLQQEKSIYLYAGDVPQNGLYNKFIGLSLSQENFQHIKHDVTHK
ncbi:MAG: hypothetical protein RLT30_04265, partial [Gammaproteobacteria bacterium]